MAVPTYIFNFTIRIQLLTWECNMRVIRYTDITLFIVQITITLYSYYCKSSQLLLNCTRIFETFVNNSAHMYGNENIITETRALMSPYVEYTTQHTSSTRIELTNKRFSISNSYRYFCNIPCIMYLTMPV